MLHKGNEKIKITFNEHFLSRVDFIRAVVRYFIKKNRDFRVIDFYHLIVDDKKYYLRDQNLTPEGAKCIQNAILIPIDD